MLGRCLSWFTGKIRDVFSAVRILVYHLLAHLLGRCSNARNETPNNTPKISFENFTIFMETFIQGIYRYILDCIISAFQNLSNCISSQYAVRILYPVGNFYNYHLHRLIYVLTMNEALGNFGSNVQLETAVERIISHIMIFTDMIHIHQEEPLSNYEATVFLMHHVLQLLTKCCLFLFLLIALNVTNIPFFIFDCLCYYWQYMIYLLSNKVSTE